MGSSRPFQKHPTVLMGPSFMVPLFVARLIEDLLRTVLSPPKSCLLSSTVKKPYLKDSWDLLDNTACMAWAKTFMTAMRHSKQMGEFCALCV